MARQVAEVVEGHHLRSNQYLLVRVYNEEEARKNWTKAVVKPAGAEGDAAVTSAPPPDLTVGKQLIIRGTEVSFYIPPGAGPDAGRFRRRVGRGRGARRGGKRGAGTG